MGNSTSLPYTLQDQLDFDEKSIWKLFNGVKSAPDVENQTKVSVFKYSKIDFPDKLQLAQRGVQKLRTIRHPYILSYVESVELDDSILLVTESCVPLKKWIQQLKEDMHSSTSNVESKREEDEEDSLHSEYLWGVKCILKGLDFLHTTCSAIHGNISLNSIFVTPNGDWKIGSLELLCNMKIDTDLNHFISYSHILDAEYQSAERTSLITSVKSGSMVNTNKMLEDLLTISNPPSFMDTYSLSVLIKKLYGKEDSRGHFTTKNSNLDKIYSNLVSENYKKRSMYSIKKILRNEVFLSNLYINLMENLNDFNILENYTNILTIIFNKIFYAQKEEENSNFTSNSLVFNDNYYTIIETNSQIITKNLKSLSKFICNFKIFPILNTIGNKLYNDYTNNRNLKESSRNYLNFLLLIYAVLCKYKKIFISNFTSSFSNNLYLKLWTVNDRNIRLILLKTLKYFSNDDDIPESFNATSSPATTSSSSSLVSTLSSSFFSSSSSTTTSATTSSMSYLSENFINNDLFFVYLNGFNDTNVKIKESTLLNIVYFIKKLNSKNFNDNLIKILNNLQNDNEVSIRTNTIILISKILKYFNQNSKDKYLANFLMKSIKDSFVPCRLAGLKALQICISSLNFNDYCVKILPQIIILSIDNFQEVRDISISLIENSLLLIKNNHQAMCKKEQEQRILNEKNSANMPNSNGLPANQNNSSNESSWSSWGGTVLQGITKAIDIPTPHTPTNNSLNKNNSLSSNNFNSNSNTNFNSKFSTNSSGSSDSLSSMNNNINSFTAKANEPKSVKSMKWDDDDFGFNDNGFNDKKLHASSLLPKSTPVKKFNDFGEDDFDFDSDENEKFKDKKITVVSPPAPKPTPVKKFNDFGEDDFDFDQEDDHHNVKKVHASSSFPKSTPVKKFKNFGEEDFDFESEEEDKFKDKKITVVNPPAPKPTPVKKFNDFGEDDFDFDDESPKTNNKKDLFGIPKTNSYSVNNNLSLHSNHSSNTSLNSFNQQPRSRSNSTSGTPKASVTKPAIKKLDFTMDEEDNWDDF